MDRCRERTFKHKHAACGICGNDVTVSICPPVGTQDSRLCFRIFVLSGRHDFPHFLAYRTWNLDVSYPAKGISGLCSAPCEPKSPSLSSTSTLHPRSA